MTRPSTSILPPEEAFATAAATEVAFAGDAPPTRIELFRYGTHDGKNGSGRYELTDRAHAEAVVAASVARLGSSEMPIDYDHQMPFGAVPGVGGKAVAAGWIKQFHITDAGIDADVEWTDAASAHLKAREYRYISPYFGHEKGSGRVTRFINAALTNLPNLELRAVASQQGSTGDESMIDLKKIAGALGLGDTADEAAILTAIDEQKAAASATAKALGLAETAKPEEVTAAASALAANSGNPDPAKFVPIATVTEMQSAMSSLKSQIGGMLEAEQAKVVDQAIADGKLIPAQKDWALNAINSDATAFASFLATTPAMKLGDRILDEKVKGADGLTTEERAVASQMGITPEAFAKSKAELEAA